MGDQYLRCLLVNGMASRARSAKIKPDKADPWLLSLLEHKPAKLAAVARLIWEANKTARIAWVVLTNGNPTGSARNPIEIHQFARTYGVMRIRAGRRNRKHREWLRTLIAR